MGLLTLHQITWDSPAALLEKLIEYEAVHKISSWDDLKGRLTEDRRCFAFFHPKMNNEQFVGFIVPNELRALWKLYKLPDRKALKIIFKEIDSIDICHYDSDKSYRGRNWAYPLLWSKLRSGGIFISDDINDNMCFKEFSEALSLTPIIVYLESENKYIGLLEKP